MPPSGTSLGAAMGQFGTPHTDDHDDPSGFTAMLANPDLPPDYSFGEFYYFDFGIFIKPRSMDCIIFSGLHRHGGTPPCAPAGMAPLDHAYRFNVVAYPNAVTVRGLGPTAFGPLAAVDRLLMIPPEMRHRMSYVVSFSCK
jgi:hypothetical protein